MFELTPYIYLVPLGLLLFVFVKKLRQWQYPNNDTQPIQNDSSSGQTASRSSNGNELYDVQRKQSSSSKSAISKHQKQSQIRSGTGGTLNKRSEKMINHPWLLTSLKGHTDHVLDIDYSSNGKYLASCSQDRTLLLWTAGNIHDTQQRKSLRVNVEYDHAVKLTWSPDSKAILIHKALENCIEVIRIEKKDGFLANPSKGVTFRSAHESDVIVGFGIACTGRFIMSASNKTDFVLWNLKGTILDKIDTCLASNNAVKISPCGRFIAACGFSPDVKVWEVKFAKTGEYQKTVNVFNLSGHNSGIYDLAFDKDTSHIATVSKDGTWKIFDTKIEFDLGQSARCIVTSKFNHDSTAAPLIALSLNAEVVAVWNGTNIEIFSGLDGTRDAVIDEFGITSLKFDPLSKYLLTTGDRHVRVYHNVTGYKVSSAVAKSKLNATNQSAATRERLEKLIAENEQFLVKFE